MIDFDLALGPAMVAFARPVAITPTASQPGAPAYTARAVWALKQVDIPLEHGGYHSTQQPTLGIRLAEFATSPDQGDSVVVNAITYEIVDVNPDGQGGADMVLREIDS